MQLIAHRINTIDELRKTPLHYGVEIDIRSFRGALVLHHEPFIEGEHLKEWLKCFHHKTLILNVKEEGLEDAVLKLLEEFHVKDYFFLDQSFPFLIKYSNLGLRKAAVRLSEYEAVETVIRLSGMVNWVWVDCFSELPLTKTIVRKLKQSNYNICIVSPELQGRNADIEIQEMCLKLQKIQLMPDAVCTKRPDLWEEFQTL